MPETPIYALRTPDPNDVPDVAADMQNLAEDVEDELARIDSTATGLEERLTALETGTGGAGLIFIGNGSAPAGKSFVIDLTAGGKFPSPPLWNQIKVFMRVDLTAADLVLCRINSDADTVYRSGGYTVDAAGAVEDPWAYSAISAWGVARCGTAGTNTIEFTLFASDFAPGLHAFQSTFTRESDSTSVNQVGQGHGSLMSGGKTVTSLEFRGNASTDFVNAWWTAMGVRTAHPS